jgi:hypothetical protein
LVQVTIVSNLIASRYRSCSTLTRGLALGVGYETELDRLNDVEPTMNFAMGR